MFDGWKFLAGLGIFLFGMFLIEESIKLLAGRSLKAMIGRFTGTRLRSLATGLLSTAVLQSSSAVTLMILAFVGAGLLTLANAVAVILGTMVGTTLTAWIVAVFGFSIKIDALALPMIGIGGLGLIVLGRSPRYVNVTKLVAALGFLFLGLDYMKASVEALAASVDLSALPDTGAWAYVLAGIALTAIMQSSSAAIAVILTAIFSGIIGFGQAAAMVIGANIGTTVTALLGSVGGTPAKKRAAFSTLIFNIVTAAVVLPFLPAFLRAIGRVFDPAHDAVLGIAAFHTMFNVIGVVIFFPAITPLVTLLGRLFPERNTTLTRYVHNASPAVPEAAAEVLLHEVLRQLSLSMSYVAERYRLAPSGPSRDGGTPGEAPAYRYEDLEQLHALIFDFYARVLAHGVDERDALRMEAIIRSSRSIMHSVRNFSTLHADVAEFGRDDNPFLAQAHGDFIDRLKRLSDTVVKVCGDPADPSIPGETDDLFQWVERTDRDFILSFSRAVAGGSIREQDVTKILMTNRYFTQAARMIILGVRTIIGGVGTLPEGVDAHTDGIG